MADEYSGGGGGGRTGKNAPRNLDAAMKANAAKARATKPKQGYKSPDDLPF
jgi:hypothetical protein